MPELNKKVCVVGGTNTGFGDCVLSFGTIVGAFLVPKDLELTPSDLADLEAKLKDLAMDADPKQRIYPIHYFEGITDNTEDKTIETLGYGGKYPVREGYYDWMFRFLQGGICLLKSLQQFNGTGKYALFYDANGVLFGQKSGDNLKGVPLSYFWADKWRPSDGSAAPNYSVQFVFRPEFINQYLGFVEADFPLVEVEGLQNVVLAEGAGSARPVLKITAKAGCDGTNLYDTYSAELAAVGAWKATINGNDIDITSVVVDANISGWTVTVDNADPDYVAGEPMIISLADPVALDGLGVTGFESKTLTIAAE